MNRADIYVVRLQAEHGIGTAAIRLCEDLRDLGCSVRIFTARADRVSRSGVRVHRLRIRLPYSLELPLLAAFTFLHSRLSGRRVRHAIEVPAAYSWIHIHGDPWDASKTMGQRGVHALLRREARRVVQASSKRAMRTGTAVVPSASLGVRLASHNDGAFIVLPNALSPSDPFLVPMPVAVPVPGSSDSRRIGLVAQGDLRYKGVHRALEALNDLAAGHFLEVAGVSELPRELPTSVKARAVGNLDRARYRAWLESCAGIIVAATYESFSLVALEAAIVGAPILALGHIGISEFATDDSLGIYRPWNCEAWEAALSLPKRPRPELNEQFCALRRARLKDLS